MDTINHIKEIYYCIFSQLQFFLRCKIAAYIESWVHDVNVIGIDWGKLSSHNGLPHYFIAANNAIKAGEYAGQLLSKMLIQGLGAKPKSFHAIGHSLGAHVVGHFGRTIQSENEAKIFRVTGNFNDKHLTGLTIFSRAPTNFPSQYV